MKRQIILWLFCMLFKMAAADNFLTLVPQAITPGSTSDDARMISFDMELSEEDLYQGIEFDLILPKGITLDESAFELDLSRFPGKRGKSYFTPSYGIPTGKDYYHVLIFSTDASKPKLKGLSGHAFDVYYLSESDINEDILKIEIRNVNFPISSSVSSFPSDAISFLYKEDTDWSNIGCVDLAQDGCLVSGDVADEARMLMTNPNALLYVNEGSSVEGLDNVVAGDRCESLVLTDGHAFHASKAFTAASAAYSRSIAADGWYSLCLPFAAEVPDGVTVERLQGMAADGSSIDFAAGPVEADKPCIFSAEAGEVVFSGSNVAVAATPDVLQDGDFVGTYSQTLPGGIAGHYALRADGSGFGKADGTAYATPFRATILPVGSASFIRISHNGDVATGIQAVSGYSGNDCVYTLSGMRANIGSLPKGVYVGSNRKFIIR